MGDVEDGSLSSPEVHFHPVVDLPLVEPKTCEEDEEELIKLRARLFRYDSVEQPPQWKERGTGEVKILKHKTKSICRIVMRRDKTLKICANHYIQPFMKLQPSAGSDRAWVWSTPADFADEEARTELLAIRFANAETAMKFKTAFEDAKLSLPSALEENKDTNGKSDKSSGEITKKLQQLTVQDAGGDSTVVGNRENVIHQETAKPDETVHEENCQENADQETKNSETGEKDD